jgi:hypothetical protein
MAKWHDITDILTKKGIDKLKVGQVLMFEFEGSETQIKVMRKANGKVWGKEVYLYKEDEIFVKDKVA